MSNIINWVAKKKINYNIIKKLTNICLEKNQFANNGDMVKNLENLIYDKLQIDENKKVIVVTNGSVAIHALILSINFYYNKNLKWATQSFTFPPSAQGPLSECNIYDIDLEGGIDLEEIDDNVDGIIVTNIFGNVVNINKYTIWAKKNNKFLIFDNAATAYSYYNNKNACNYGIGATISFHHTKPLGFGEGGAIIVDSKFENIIRNLNNFGINLTKNYFYKYGNNFKMSEISAIYIIQYLENLNKLVKKHNKLFIYFNKKIKQLKQYKLFPNFADKNSRFLSCFCIIYKNNSDNIIKEFNDNGICCRKYYNPLKQTTNSINLYNNIICLPCNFDITYQNINQYIDILKKY